MTAIAAITLNDAQATPVAHVFNPARIDNGVSTFVDRSGGIALGYPTITQSLRLPSKGNRNYKLSLKVVVPVLEVTSASTGTGIQPAPTKAYDLLGSIEFVLPERSTLQQRKDLLAYVQQFLVSSPVNAAVQNFEGLY